MAIPKTSCVCGTIVRGTGWRIAFKWCMLPYGPIPGATESLFGVGGRWGRRAAWKPTETDQYWEPAKSSLFGQSRWTTSSLPGDRCRIWSRLTWKVASTRSCVEAHVFLRVKSHSSSPKFTISRQQIKFLLGLTSIGIAPIGKYQERVSLDACLLGRQNMTELLGWPNFSRARDGPEDFPDRKEVRLTPRNRRATSPTSCNALTRYQLKILGEKLDCT